MVQETHYDPWGVELQGLGYQEPGIKVNKYLYNGKEFNDHLGINLFDYGARLYDASIGRWFVVDPLAEAAPDWTPYRYGFNNPVKFIDPNGMFEWTDGYGTYDSRNSTVSRSSFSGMYSEGKDAVFLGMNYSVNAQGERTSVIHRYVEYADGSTKNITSTGNFGSPALFGAGGFGDMGDGRGNLLKALSTGSYLLGTYQTGLIIYADYRLKENELKTLRRSKALGSSRYGANTAIKSSNKLLNGVKIVGKGLSKPFFFTGLGLSAIDVANGGSLEWAIADTTVGALGLGATTIGAALGAPIVGSGIAIGAVGYFTFRIGSEIYKEFE